MKVGDIVKLKNPKKKGEAKRRWSLWGVIPNTEGQEAILRRLDTSTRRLEHHPETYLDSLATVSFWERLIKRY